MRQGLFLVVLVGVVLSGCAAPGEPLWGKPTYQVVGGLIAENKHSPKDGGVCTPKQAAKQLCWENLGDVEIGRGKYTRYERYLTRDFNGRTIYRDVLYFDSEKQTEVYVLDENSYLRDDFVTSIPKFSLKQDRHDYGI